MVICDFVPIKSKNALTMCDNVTYICFTIYNTANMALSTESCKYNLDTEGQFFLIVTYEAFEDVTPDTGGGMITQIRTVDLMGTAPVNPDQLPDWLQDSITQACASHAAHKLYEIETV